MNSAWSSLNSSRDRGKTINNWMRKIWDKHAWGTRNLVALEGGVNLCKDLWLTNLLKTLRWRTYETKTRLWHAHRDDVRETWLGYFLGGRKKVLLIWRKMTSTNKILIVIPLALGKKLKGFLTIFLEPITIPTLFWVNTSKGV